MTVTSGVVPGVDVAARVGLRVGRGVFVGINVTLGTGVTTIGSHPSSGMIDTFPFGSCTATPITTEPPGAGVRSIRPGSTPAMCVLVAVLVSSLAAIHPLAKKCQNYAKRYCLHLSLARISRDTTVLT